MESTAFQAMFDGSGLDRFNDLGLDNGPYVITLHGVCGYGFYHGMADVVGNDDSGTTFRGVGDMKLIPLRVCP